ncbi:DUF438 domain-containing protein [Fundicoccus culcitae]|uniref:DUF438 domain-containing protein n=1 Tax=Fundicoccus culcitae TaxID=2969821 RepID=A0ABY5P4R1_9LACT|nr:DUF438 domain-containing protein [Fundicoccus culcitae]UUX33595.1 DUF438 domain-containing protein [Fundicoccus culcitae]
MSEPSNKRERIDIIEDMLLKLHDGASPESIQDEFNEHFTGVSAIEISMMEHQLINSKDNDLTFEDVLKLCNVHANLFKNSVIEGDSPEADKEGHPVRVFKDENAALRSALLRIHNLHEAYAELPKEEIEDGMIRGLRHQYDLLGQYEHHYDRKEKLFFPVMEKYGHDAPPKVMWAKDDEIRDLFKKAYKTMLKFPEVDYREITETFAAFEYEFNEMIFKEETILINILLDALSMDDWHQIAQESDAYGYAIIAPTAVWDPPVVETEEVRPQPTPTITSATTLETQRIAVDGGVFTISYEAGGARQRLVDPNSFDRNHEIQIGDGYLTINQMAMLLDYLPLEITVVDANDIVQYSNFNADWDGTYYMRDFNTLSRSTETIYEAEVFTWVKGFKSGTREKQSMKHGHFELTLIPLVDPSNIYLGYIELAHNLAPYAGLGSTVKRGLTDFADFEGVPIKAVAVVAAASSSVSLQTQKLAFDSGDLLLTWESHESADALDWNQPIAFRNGHLSLSQVTTIFNAVPLEITFVDGDEVFQYYNNIVDYGDMIFVRTPAQVKRNMELCHPPYLWPMVQGLVQSFRDKKRYYETMWFPRGDGKLVYTLYQAMYDTDGGFRGMLETVLDIKPFLEK